MAPGSEPPSVLVSSPTQPSVARVPSPLQPPPSIVFAPTSDDEEEEEEEEENLIALDVAPQQPGLSTTRGAPALDPIHPHDAALLRRSPSPHLHSSTQSASGLLSPELFRTSFLRPPHDATMGGGNAESESAQSAPAGEDGAAPAENPFNFQTQYISTSPVKSNIGMRRGHRYKHSSVSAQHQIFQEPPPRPPPVLPASLPLPTVREAWASMQRDQRARLYWCLCHGTVAVFVFLCAGDSLALTALSHLVFFDVGSAAVCVAVDVLGNFEVWRRSTIRHPFGLRRAEVLAGFAMSIFLVFGGFDLLSHGLKDWFEAATGSGHDDHNHHVHHTRYVHPGTVDTPALAAFCSTLVSAYGLGNHARIRRALLLLHGVAPYSSVAKSRAKKGAPSTAIPSSLPSTSAPPSSSSVLSLIASLPILPAALANPFHFLTLGVSLILLVLPLLFVAVQPWLDRLLCATIALSMLMLGARLAVAQGLMLLMSFGGNRRAGDVATATGSSAAAVDASTAAAENTDTSGVAFVLDEIAAEPQIARVEDAQFWQVHYGLCMANLRLRVVRGCDDGTLKQLRSRVARVIQNRLGEGYGRGNSLRWEVTVQTSVEGG